MMGRSTVVWRDWAALAVSASLGLVLERHGNKFLKTLTAPLLATLFGLAFTNLGFTPEERLNHLHMFEETIADQMTSDL